MAVYDSRRTEAECRSLFEARHTTHGSAKPTRRDVELKNIERSHRRALQRADGIVTSAQRAALSDAEACSAYANVCLRGFGSLRCVFPDISRRMLTNALRALDDIPAADRCKLAARAVMASGLQERLVDDVAQVRFCPEAQKARGLQRARSTDCFDIKKGMAASPILVRTMSAQCVLAKADYQSPSKSVECCSDGRDFREAKTRIEEDDSWSDSTFAGAEESDYVFHDDRSFLSHRARKRAKRAESRWNLDLWRVDDRLLRAPIPREEILVAVEIAKKEAARVRREEFDDSCDLNVPPTIGWSSWETLQAQFMVEHNEALRHELGEDVEFKPIFPREIVQSNFLASCELAQTMPLPAYHGTLLQNVRSISDVGLVIPGHRGVTVANGSAHGVGIYTATLGNSSLSLGFCDSPNLFVCGVSDVPAQMEMGSTSSDAPKWLAGHRQHRKPCQQKVVPPGMMGNLKVHRRTAAVTHVGSAMVVFDEGRVAPLFLASGVRNHRRGVPVVSTTDPWPKHANPNRRDDRVGTRRVLIPELGISVWEPPTPYRNRVAIRVKRRYVQRDRHLARLGEHRNKASMINFEQ